MLLYVYCNFYLIRKKNKEIKIIDLDIFVIWYIDGFYQDF